jgi:integrase
MQLVGRPKLAKPLPKALPRSAVEALLDTIAPNRESKRQTDWAERDLALILTALLGGLRAEELSQANVGDIRTTDDGATAPQAIRQPRACSITAWTTTAAESTTVATANPMASLPAWQLHHYLTRRIVVRLNYVAHQSASVSKISQFRIAAVAARRRLTNRADSSAFPTQHGRRDG